MTSNFLGIPIEGDFYSRGQVAQKPLSELQPLLRALLDDDFIVEFGWRQYTPYFADGEVCEFGVEDLWVRTDRDTEVDDIDDLLVGEWYGEHPTLGELRITDGQAVYQGSERERAERARELADALASGAFDEVLADAFGDHAQVTVRRDGIQVDFYDHD